MLLREKQEGGCLHQNRNSFITPIPISLFLSDNICLLLNENTAGIIDSFFTKSMFTQTNNEQRCRDGVMNEFLFWCRHPLAPPFHKVTSLHSLSFQRNGFSNCMLYYHH